MLIGLKVSSLACKCVFYGPDINAKGDRMELNFEGLEIQKWNIPTYRAQRFDEKNGAIRLIIMFNPKVMVFKMSRIVVFFNFLLITAKN